MTKTDSKPPSATPLVTTGARNDSKQCPCIGKYDKNYLFNVTNETYFS